MGKIESVEFWSSEFLDIIKFLTSLKINLFVSLGAL